MAEQNKVSKGRLRLLEAVVEQARVSHKWMLDSIQHASDETSGGNYSDELKHAIDVQKLLDVTKKLDAVLEDE